MADSREVAKALLDFFIVVQSRSGGEYFRLLCEAGLTVSQYRALAVLARAGEPMTVKELADRLALSAPATSRAIDALVGRLWVARSEDGHDRRQKRLQAMAAGRYALRRFDEARLEGLDGFLQGMPAETREALYAAVCPFLAAQRQRPNAQPEPQPESQPESQPEPQPEPQPESFEPANREDRHDPAVVQR